MTSPADPPLLTVTEAAQYLRCSASHLNKLRVTGGGPPFAKIGARVVYRRIDLDRWVEKQVRKSTAGGKAA
jgi:excisionase family DNA binding protein